MADFIIMILAAYAGKHMREDIEKNFDKYDY